MALDDRAHRPCGQPAGGPSRGRRTWRLARVGLASAVAFAASSMGVVPVAVAADAAATAALPTRADRSGDDQHDRTTGTDEVTAEGDREHLNDDSEAAGTGTEGDADGPPQHATGGGGDGGADGNGNGDGSPQLLGDDGGFTTFDHHDDDPADGATITLITETVPAGEDTSAFTMSVTGPVTVSGATGEAAVTGASVPAGTYTLASAAAANWGRDPWTCTLNGDVTFTVAIIGGTVTLAAGDTLSCTMTRYRFAELTLLAASDPPGAAGSVQLTAAGAISGSVIVQGASGATGRSPLGFYRLSAAELAGWERGGWDCGVHPVAANHPDYGENVIRLEYGDVVSCTVPYTWSGGTLTLAAVSEPAGNEGLFTLSATGPATVSGVTGDVAVTDALVPAGTYTLGGQLANWSRSSWSCRRNGGSPFSLPQSAAQLTIDAGDAVVCTITFRRLPHLTLLATTDPPGGEGDFVLWAERHPDGGGGNHIVGTTGTNGHVPALQYRLMAYTDADWVPGEWSCDIDEQFDDDGYIRLRHGDVVTCTLAHTAATMPTTTTEPGGDTTSTLPGGDMTTLPGGDTTTLPGGDMTTLPGGDMTTLPGGDMPGTEPGGGASSDEVAGDQPATTGTARTQHESLAGELPVTGAGDETALLALAAVVLLCGGGAIVALTRRRGSAAAPR